MAAMQPDPAAVTPASVVIALCSVLFAVLLALTALYWRRLPVLRRGYEPGAGLAVASQRFQSGDFEETEKFDPKVLECKDGDGPGCLTASQVETARKIYSNVINPRTKQELFPGHEPGSELGWGLLAGGKEPAEIGATHYRYIVYKDPRWDWHSLDWPLASLRGLSTV